MCNGMKMLSPGIKTAFYVSLCCLRVFFSNSQIGEIVLTSKLTCNIWVIFLEEMLRMFSEIVMHCALNCTLYYDWSVLLN